MKNEFANGIKKIFFVVIAALSMATSFLYFVEVFSFGRGLISETWISVIVNGSVGVIVLDGAAIAWLKIYLGSSDNNTVRALAATGMIIGVIGSAVSSFAYLLISANGYNVAPDMRLYTQIAMASIIVIHFVLVFASGYKSTSAQIDEKTSEMMAEATKEMLTLTEEYFREAIPGLAQQNAHKLTDRLRGQFSKLSIEEGKTAVSPNPPAQPTANYYVIDPVSGERHDSNDSKNARTNARFLANRRQRNVTIFSGNGRIEDTIQPDAPRQEPQVNHNGSGHDGNFS